MVKPVYFVLGAIPVIVAILLALPLVTKNEIPVSASNSFDKLEIEYTKHQLKKYLMELLKELVLKKLKLF